MQYDSRFVLAKVEATPGTFSTPAATDLIETTGVEQTRLEADRQDVARDNGTGANSATIPTRKRGTYTMPTFGTPSGTLATAPKIDALLRACGLASVVTAMTSVTYTPVAEGFESTSLVGWFGDAFQNLSGVRANLVISLTAGALPDFRFTVVAPYQRPTAGTAPALDFSAFALPLVVDSVSTDIKFNGVSYDADSVTIDLGTNPRFTERTAQRETEIDRPKPTGTLQILKPATSSVDFFALADSDTPSPQPLLIVFGTTAGSIVEISIPACQIETVQEVESEGKIALQLGWRALPDASSDDIIITYR